MKFPGENRIILNEDAIKGAIVEQLMLLHGDVIRVTAVALDRYPTQLIVEFTTDPEPTRVVSIGEAA